MNGSYDVITLSSILLAVMQNLTPYVLYTDKVKHHDDYKADVSVEYAWLCCEMMAWSHVAS